MDFMKKRLERENEKQKNTINRQREEIEALQEELMDLQLDNEKKDKIIELVEKYQKEMQECISEINNQKNEYQKLIDELKEMKRVANESAFNNRWWLIRLLMK